MAGVSYFYIQEFIMGAFVLGILVGWLAEWLFFTFWVKSGKESDCSSIMAELEEREREINRLQNKLSEATVAASKAESTTSNKASKAAVTKEKKSETKTVSKKKTTKPAPKKAATKTTVKAKKIGDDFTKLSGIGPRIDETLKNLGIDTYTKLAETDDDILRDMLESSGARLNNNKEIMDSWNEQAMLAAKGDFDGLKKIQEALKK